MKLLLNTHIWLWYFLGNPQLSQNLKTLIPDRTTELWLSPISIWETLMIAERGRIDLQPSSNQWIDLALNTLPIREAALNYEIARLSRQVAFPHQDPADRFIAATAIHYNLTLATVDHNLLNISGLNVIS